MLFDTIFPACIILQLKSQVYPAYVVVPSVILLRNTITFHISGDIVCDPMCGGGSISIEGSISSAASFHVAGDNHEVAVQYAQDNFEAVCGGQKDRTLTYEFDNLIVFSFFFHYTALFLCPCLFSTYSRYHAQAF